MTAPRPNRRARFPISDLTNAFGSTFAAVLLALIGVFGLATDVRRWLGDRDGLLTWVTAATLALAFVIGIWAHRRASDDTGFSTILPVTAGLMLAQHLRWGVDLLGFPLPTLSGIETGSLLDLREVVSLNAERLGLGLQTAVAVLVLIGGATLGAALWARRWAHHRVLVTEAPVVMWLVAAVGSAVAVPASGIFGEGSVAWFFAGMVNLTSAGFLVMAALAAGDHRRTIAGWRRRIWPWIAHESPLAGIGPDRGPAGQ